MAGIPINNTTSPDDALQVPSFSSRPLLVLADGDADAREATAQRLAPHYSVVTVADEEAALQAIRARVPDLVLCDVRLVGSNGLGLVGALRGDDQLNGIPLIVLLAQADTKASMAGADDYLFKPFTADELLARVALRLRLASERVRAEAQVRRSEAQFRELANALPEVVWITSADGSNQFINAQWLDYTGLGYDESLTDANQAIHPDDRSPAVAAWQEAQTAGVAYEARLRLRRADGVYRWFLARSIPVRDADGKIVRWFGSSTDIHERMVSEQDARFLSDLSDLIRASEQPQALLAASAELIGRHVQVRRCCFAKIDEVQGHWSVEQDYHDPALSSLVGSYRLANYPPPVIAELRNGRTYVSVDNAADPRVDGYYSIAYAPLRLRAHVVVPFVVDGRWAMNLIVGSDMPRHWEAREVALLETAGERVWLALEKLRANAALRDSEARLQVLYAREQAARAEAEEASRLKDEFLATVSHELRTPLTSILGYGQLLQGRERDPAYIMHTAAKIVQSAHAQAQLIEDLLDVSRIVTGKLRLEAQELDLIAVIQAAVDAVRPAIDAKGLRLELLLDERNSIVVGDPHRLQQVVWNLLSNAAKFTPPGGSITIQLFAVEEEVQLMVRDSGQGISAAFLPHVFERFRQADATSTRAHNGLGLGLSIVRHLVEMHGGTVAAHSDGEGQGATFTVVLPRGGQLVGQDSDDANTTKARLDCPAELRGLRVLVVDDQPSIVELIEETLSQCGAVVRTYTSAREAFNELRTWRPDLLLSDIAMPGEDGYWLIRELRALPKKEGGNIPAVALTAYVRVEDRTRVLEAGFQLFVPKPVEPSELLRVIAGLMSAGTPPTEQTPQD